MKGLIVHENFHIQQLVSRGDPAHDTPFIYSILNMCATIFNLNYEANLMLYSREVNRDLGPFLEGYLAEARKLHASDREGLSFAARNDEAMVRALSLPL